MSSKVRATAPAGNKAQTAIAWYQTLDTYKGDQETFHARHLTTPMAREFMNLKCTFCHQGNDPRDEAPGSSATTTPLSAGGTPLRKMVDAGSTCLLCHGQFPAANMGLEGKWSELREGMESAKSPNGCLTCHAEQFRTNRHQVNYLNASAIEAAAKTNADLCYGCHGGRSWYRITYPYPRHPWPGMDTGAAPDSGEGTASRVAARALGGPRRKEVTRRKAQDLEVVDGAAVEAPVRQAPPQGQGAEDMINPTAAGSWHASSWRDALNLNRRDFLRSALAGAAVAGASMLPTARKAHAFAYEPYPKDDDLTTVVTSCAHNCGSRHMLVAHKKGDVIVRLSTDDGRYQEGGSFGKDTELEPQIRACLRGRSYRVRLYSPERLLYPMMRVGQRGEGKFKRVSWEEALTYTAKKMVELKEKYGPTALLDQSYAGASYGVLHKSDQIEGLLARFLGMFGCRTSSWSVPSYQGTTFSSRMTFGTIEDGNEDDAYAHAKLIIMWGWNPAYTFHGGNTFYYMRLAKQRGCKFVVVDPQYTDSASAYDAWSIPIKPNTDAAMLAAMAHYIWANNLHDQKFMDKFVQGLEASTMPDWAKDKENFKDYIFGKYDGQPKTPEWAEPICGVKAADIKKLAQMYATTKPAALKASWSPGRNAYGEQYNRMAAAVQSMTGNIGILGGSAEGVGKGFHNEAVAYPYDEYSNVWYASIKSDRWAHCVLNYPNLKREEIGCWPRNDDLDGKIPNIKAIFWQGSDWFNKLTNINKQIEAIRKLELVVCMDSTITPSACGRRAADRHALRTA